MKVEIQETWFSLEECEANPNKLYVFGDNTLRVGKGGQASIRDAENSIGLATKRLPTMEEKAFFADREDEAEIILRDLTTILETYMEEEYEVLVLPYAKLGTGLSEMPQRSPELFRWMNQSISLLFGIDYTYKPII